MKTHSRKRLQQIRAEAHRKYAVRFPPGNPRRGDVASLAVNVDSRIVYCLYRPGSPLWYLSDNVSVRDFLILVRRKIAATIAGGDGYSVGDFDSIQARRDRLKILRPELIGRDGW